MITVVKTKKFEMPKSCDENCPFHHSLQEGNATWEYCELKKRLGMKNYGCHYRKNTMTGYEYFKDPNCPLENGKTYEI